MPAASVQTHLCNTQPNQPPADGLDVDEANLSGLRNFLNDWNAGEGLQRERDGVLEKAKRDDARASIYSMYNEHATREDKELVSRWSETLNILLTFAGLQSAVITAFIVNMDSDLKPDPSAITNQILLGILNKLDNTTKINAWPDSNAVQHNANVVSKWWYFSLACSLLSAFGALMCKQWVLHYRSRPGWANTSQKRAQLRELRYQGLKTWWFFGVINSLTILLQMSVFFFGVGLATHLRRTSIELFIIVESFLSSSSAFYILATVVGALYPACPFKSPITEFTQTIGWKIIGWIRLCLETLYTFACIILGWSFCYHSYVRGLVSQLRDRWCLVTVSNPMGRMGKEASESLVVGEHTIQIADAGILCWWAVHQHDPSFKHARQPDTKAAVDVITSISSTVMLDYVNRTEFQRWASTVVENLDNLIHSFTPSATTTPRQTRAVQAGDALCHFMHQSPAVTSTALLAIEDEASDSVGHFCQTIREAWTGLGRADLLPISTMRWTTIAVYLRVQLLDWCNPLIPKPGEPRYRAQIVKELPVLMRDPRLQGSLADAANVVSLAAVALVLGDAPGIRGREELTRSEPWEQLLVAIHRLSYYGPDLTSTNITAGPNPLTQPSQNLFSLLIKTSRIALSVELQNSGPSGLLKSSFLKNGLLGDALLRLLTLGTSFRENQSSPSRPQSLYHFTHETSVGDQPGTLLQELHRLIVEIVESLAPHPELGPGLFSLSSSMGLACIFDAYAHKNTAEPLNHESLQVLDYTLGLRHRRPRCPLPFARRQSSVASVNSRNSIASSLIEERPHILDRLIHDVQNALAIHNDGPRHLLLSVIAKGKDLFFPPDLGGNHAELLQELSEIAEQQSVKSRNPWKPLESSALTRFQRWVELLQALQDSAGLLRRC